MYPDVGFFLKQVFGIDIPFFSLFKMFGLLLATAFLASGYILHLELKRKEAAGVVGGIQYSRMLGEAPSFGEILPAMLLYGFFLGKFFYAILNVAEFSQDPAFGLFAPTKMNWIAFLIGAIAGGYWRYNTMKQEQLPEPKEEIYTLMPSERVGDIVIAAAISGLIGAKLMAVAEYTDQLIADPIGTLFSGSGLAFLGGLIGGAIGVIWYAKRIKIPISTLVDVAGMAVITGYGVGRLGCQLSGDGDWGIPNPNPAPDWWFLPNWLWSYNYPHNVAQDGELIPGCVGQYCTQLAVPAYPTPIYETLLCGIILAILWSLRKRIAQPGILFCLFLILLGIERFLIEFMRHNDLYNVAGFQLSQAQIISFCMIIGGLIGGIYIRMKNPFKEEILS